MAPSVRYLHEKDVANGRSGIVRNSRTCRLATDLVGSMTARWSLGKELENGRQLWSRGAAWTSLVARRLLEKRLEWLEAARPQAGPRNTLAHDTGGSTNVIDGSGYTVAPMEITAFDLINGSTRWTWQSPDEPA